MQRDVANSVHVVGAFRAYVYVCGRGRPGGKLDLADWRRGGRKGLALIECAVTNLLSDRRGVFVTLRLRAPPL